MNDDEINRWIRWQQRKVSLTVAAEFLCMAFNTLAVIVWFVIRYVQQ